MYTLNARTISILILIVIVVLLGLFYVFVYENDDKFVSPIHQNNNIGTSKVLYYRLKGLNYDMPSLPLYQTFLDAFKDEDIIAEPASEYRKALFIQFDSLNTIDTYMRNLYIPPSVKFIHGLQGTDILASKRNLAISFYNEYGSSAHKYIPESYIPDTKDMTKLQKEFSKKDHHDIYIMKKDVQRQEGFYITDSISDILVKQNDYVVVQKILQNPYVISGMKINLRVYLLVTYIHGKARFYYYDNGFLYYTPKQFIQYSKDADRIITTGYIDRKVYEENPLTLYDLREYLRKDYSKLADSIKECVKGLKRVYKPVFETENNRGIGDELRFLIFGMDLAPDNKLNCKIIEVNKGPDLSYKDDRDKAVKLTMAKDCLKIVGLIPCEDDKDENGWIEV